MRLKGICVRFQRVSMQWRWCPADLLEGEVGAGAGIGMGMGIAVAPAPPLEPGWLVTGSLPGSWGRWFNGLASNVTLEASTAWLIITIC